jgi:hypothetical protein
VDVDNTVARDRRPALLDVVVHEPAIVTADCCHF